MLQAKQIEEKYNKLLNAKDMPVRENSIIQVHLKRQKAVNDLLLAEGLFRISTEPKLKKALGFPDEATFFDWVVVSSYYSIFHATQALLGLKKVKIEGRRHYATMIAFAKHFVISNELAEELYLIYEDSEAKARELLDIFEEEKGKRGLFQYHRLSRHNIEPARESLVNARKFLEAIQEVLSRNRLI